MIRRSASRFRSLVFLLAGVLALPSIARAAGASGEWGAFTPSGAAPLARQRASLIFDAGSGGLYLFGGAVPLLGGSTMGRDDVWRLDASTWTQISPSGSSPGVRWGQGAILDPVRQRAIVFGGSNTAALLNTVVAFSLAGSPVWSAIVPAGTPPPPRRDALVVYDPVRDRLLLFGGFTGSAYSNQVWTLNLSGAPAWTQMTVAGTPPSGRATQGAYDPTGDRLVFFGGFNGTSPLADLWQLTLSGIPTWSPLSATGVPPSGMQEGIGVYDPGSNRLLFFGGRDGSLTVNNRLWSLTLSGIPAWSELTIPGAPSARLDMCGAFDALHQRIVLFGGTTNGTTVLNDAWGLSTTSGAESWTALVPPGGPAPPPNADYALAFDSARNRGVFFGGGPVGIDPTWIWQLGPAPGFSQLLTAHRPPPRRSANAIYDAVGDRVVLFGGNDPTGSALSDVWSLGFVGVPDWAQVAATSPPTARTYSTSIYDPVRQRLVMFGGLPLSNFDTWALPLTGPPAWSHINVSGISPPRYGHSAVYDPFRDRMLVFGGNNNATDLNDVWALTFEPSLGWQKLSPLGTPPSGRRSTSLVFDSLRDRLLVFGGFSGSAFMNDVWELSLSPTVAWTQLLPANLPPEVRDQIGTLYDSARDRLAVYGGWNGHPMSDAWFLTFDRPTAVDVSLIQARVIGGSVALIWGIGPNSDRPAAIERSIGGAEWETMTALEGSGARVEWIDPSPPAGSRVGYRLRFLGAAGESYAGDVWVETPVRARLAIRGFAPNPALTRATASLVTPARGSAIAEILDLAGRRVGERDLGVLEAGTPRVSLDGLDRLPPGLYQVRIRQGEQRAIGRLLVVR